MFFNNKRQLIALAPMAGITDEAFRKTCKKYGAGLLFSEMISSRGLCYNDKKTFTLMRFSEEQRPFGIQLFGNQPDIMAEAAKRTAELKPDFIDINMGCPTPKIVNNGDGCALMKDTDLAGRVISAVAKAVDIPVSVKFRLGWDSITCVDFALMCQDSGAAFVSLHGRTKKQQYSGAADWQAIADTKKAIKIPLIANGDVTGCESAKKILDITGADGIMIGRGTLGNPFIFKQIMDFLDGKEVAQYTLEQRMAAALEHFALIAEIKGEKTGIKEARKHALWYVKGQKNALALKAAIIEANTLEDMKNILGKGGF